MMPRAHIPLYGLNVNGANQADTNVDNVQQAVNQGADHQPAQNQNIVQPDADNVQQAVKQGADHQPAQNDNANFDNHQGQPGRRTDRRTQSQYDGNNEVKPGRRTLRRARTEYDRNVRINRNWLNQRNELQPNQLFRRSGRVSKAVELFNISEIVCFVCKRKYRENQLVSRFNHFRKNIACSFKCFAKA